jgi:hypothetical protein
MTRAARAGAIAVALVAAACGSAPAPAAPAKTIADVELLSVVDLPRGPDSEGLSGTFFDEATRTLFAVQDKDARVVRLVAGPSFASWSIGEPIALRGRPEAEWDGEGVARAASGELYVVAHETKALVERFDASGAYLGTVGLPPRFAERARDNKGIESLSISPSGRYLFAAGEAALTTDGPLATPARGTTIRVLRRDLATSTDEERAYRTEPVADAGEGEEMGVSDVTAVTDDLLLVLERSFRRGHGNGARVFRVSFTSAPDVSSRDALDAAAPVLAKTLVVDLAGLRSRGVTHPSKQPNPILENYEALALGPRLADGRRVVFVTSDDNGKPSQVPRVVTLALRLP